MIRRISWALDHFHDLTFKIFGKSSHTPQLEESENFDDVLSDVDDAKISLEDTATLLDSYVDAIRTDLSKDRLKTDMRNLYNQAQTLELVWKDILSKNLLR